MAARSIASLTVSFGLVSIPVKLYSATEASRAISFNLLHKACGSRLKQQYVCAKEEVIVPREDMAKGYEFAKDQYVMFSPGELKALEEAGTHTADIAEFVPIRRTIDFDAAREVSELVDRHLMRLHPQDITMEWSVAKRTGKIFMDYNMNVRGKTLNVAYSPRGAPGAPVSMPLTWEELAKAHPLDFRLANAAERLARTSDRWHDALTRKQNLENAVSSKPLA